MRPNTTLKIGEILYGTNDLTKVVPLRKDIPQEYFNKNHKWAIVAQDLFWNGIEKTTTVFPKPGFNAEEIKRHISCVLNIHGDFIKKDYKIATAAFLLDTWAEKIN